jgi:hypothetical protein
MDLSDGGEENPQESSRITGGEPWSPKNCLQVAGVGWGRKKRDLDEGVRESLYISRNLTRRTYPTRGSDISDPVGYVRLGSGYI